jgi:spermidine/putrescine transport system substrate-binding protein
MNRCMRFAACARRCRLFALPLVALMIVLPTPGQGAAPADLRIYNWESFLDPKLIAEFSRRTGVNVRQSFFDSDRERDLRLTAGGTSDFDLVMVDAAQVEVYRTNGWAEPVGPRRVPGLSDYDNRWRNLNGATATYAVPFAWGTLGIAYRADLVKQPPKSWMSLFQPAESLCGKLLDVDDPRELLAVALKATGHSANTAERAPYEQADQLLRAQRRCVAGYRNPGVLADSDLISGRVWAAMAYSSDAAWMQARNPKVRLMVPREGGLIWIDYWVVLASSPHKSQAFAFLAFLSEPSIAARAALYSKAASPSARARALLPAADRQNAAIDLSTAELRASETVRNQPPFIMSLRNQIFERLVRSD